MTNDLGAPGPEFTTIPDVSTSPDLTQVGAAMREEWREEQEAATRDAAGAWTHGRTLRDIALDCMHRGDRVAVVLGHHRFSGTVREVGPDLLALDTVGGRVDVHLRESVPLYLEIVERSLAGGQRAGEGRGDFRASLIAREGPEEVTLGSTLHDELFDGRLVVGADHVCVVGRGGAETYLPFGTVAFVMPRRD